MKKSGNNEYSLSCEITIDLNASARCFTSFFCYVQRTHSTSSSIRHMGNASNQSLVRSRKLRPFSQRSLSQTHIAPEHGCEIIVLVGQNIQIGDSGDSFSTMTNVEYCHSTPNLFVHKVNKSIVKRSNKVLTVCEREMTQKRESIPQAFRNCLNSVKCQSHHAVEGEPAF